MKPAASIVVPGPPPIGTVRSPLFVDTSTIVPAVSADQTLAALPMRSARVHAGDRNEVMVVEGPAPRATSQCDAIA